VNIYTIPGRSRKLSLRFLTWFLLKKDIQTKEHDSIEDARHAYLLYKQYREFDADGRFDDVMDDIFAAGHKTGFKPRTEGDETRPDTPLTGGQATPQPTPGNGSGNNGNAPNALGLAHGMGQPQVQQGHIHPHPHHMQPPHHQPHIPPPHTSPLAHTPPHHLAHHQHLPRPRHKSPGRWTPPTFVPGSRRW
jgi:hypothetical protein